MKTLYLGVDPGTNGGLAAIDRQRKVYGLRKMPNDLKSLLSWFRSFDDEEKEVYCILEQVSGYVGHAHPGSSMFEFGRGYGHIEMALEVIGLWQSKRLFILTPQKWQRGLNLRTRTKGEDDSSWKGYLKGVATLSFPEVKVTLKTADALLMAEYCRLKVIGET